MDSGSRANSFRKFRNELPQGHRAGTLKKTPAARDICAESRSSDRQEDGLYERAHR